MKYFHKLMWMFTLCIILSCEDDGFPLGLYGYQVEHLLHGDAEKMWTNDEEDGWRYLLFESLSDSVNVMGIFIDFSDTISLGMMKASVKSLHFSDTLLFSNGDFWVVEEVSSHTLLFKGEILGLGKHYNWYEIE